MSVSSLLDPLESCLTAHFCSGCTAGCNRIDCPDIRIYYPVNPLIRLLPVLVPPSLPALLPVLLLFTVTVDLVSGYLLIFFIHLSFSFALLIFASILSFQGSERNIHEQSKQIIVVITHWRLVRKIPIHTPHVVNHHKNHTHDTACLKPFSNRLLTDIALPCKYHHTCCECIDKRMHLPCSLEVQMQKPDSCSCKSACRTRKSRDPDQRADTRQKLTSKYKIGDYKYNRPFCLLYIIF